MVLLANTAPGTQAAARNLVGIKTQLSATRQNANGTERLDRLFAALIQICMLIYYQILSTDLAQNTLIKETCGASFIIRN
jgi:hypothetical protein